MFRRGTRRPRVVRPYDQLHRLIVRKYGRRWLMIPAGIAGVLGGIVVWFLTPDSELFLSRLSQASIGFWVVFVFALLVCLVGFHLVGPEENEQVESVLEVLREQAYEVDQLGVIEARANVSGASVSVRTTLSLFILPFALAWIAGAAWQLPLFWWLVAALLVGMLVTALVLEVDRASTAIAILHALVEYRYEQHGGGGGG